MSSTNEYIEELEKHRGLSNEVIEKYKKLVDKLDEEIDQHVKYELALREIICRLIEGRVSEEDRKRILEKFRS